MAGSRVYRVVRPWLRSAVSLWFLSHAWDTTRICPFPLAARHLGPAIVCWIMRTPCSPDRRLIARHSTPKAFNAIARGREAHPGIAFAAPNGTPKAVQQRVFRGRRKPVRSVHELKRFAVVLHRLRGAIHFPVRYPRVRCATLGFGVARLRRGESGRPTIRRSTHRCALNGGAT